MGATLTHLNISDGGIPKLPILMARVGFAGVEGDWQKNRKYHGGPDRAICLFSEELYDSLRQSGIDLLPGQLGDNFTTRGIDLQALVRGDRLRVGECEIQITDVREPCRQLRRWDADLPEMIVGRSGWVARVTREGIVKCGDSVGIAGP